MTTSDRSMRMGGRTGKPSFLGWTAQPDAAGSTLSEHLAEHLLISETEASDLVDFGSVQVDGRQERDPSRRLAGSEAIRVYRPWGGVRRFYEIDPERILFRDRFLLAYDKEPGIPTQQTPSDAYNNLYAALHRYLGKERQNPYAALHHRLDRDTSGVILFALDRSVNSRLGTAFREQKVLKDYLVWVEGSPSREWWVAQDPIARRNGSYTVVRKESEGKPAETIFHVLHREGDRSLLLARPKTGRTHQIRLHLTANGHPVIGDRLYAGKPANRLYLHAYRVRFSHPANASRVVVTAPVPVDWPPPHDIVLPDPPNF